MNSNKIDIVHNPNPPRPALFQSDSVQCTEDDVLRETVYFEGGHSAEYHLESTEKEGTVFVDSVIRIGEIMTIGVSLDQLECDNNRSLLIGVQFYDSEQEETERMEIDERCNLFRNTHFLEMLSLRNDKWLDTGSELRIQIENKRNEPIIGFKHCRKGKLVKFQEKSIVLEHFKQHQEAFCKVFVKLNDGDARLSAVTLSPVSASGDL